MKILFVLPDFSMGGAQRVLVSYANGLSKKGFDCSFVVISDNGPVKVDLLKEITLFSLSKKPISLVLQIKFLFYLTKWLKSHSTTVIFSTLYQLNILVSLAHLISRSDAKLILREANFPSIEWPRSRLYFILRIFGSWAYRRAHFLIGLSKMQIDDLNSYLRIPSSKVIQIPNPAFNSYSDVLSKESVSFFETLQRPIFLGIGRFCLQKRFDLLINAFYNYRLHKNASLVIIGEGSLASDYLELVSELGLDNVYLLPFTSNPFSYMRGADVFVLSSDFEGLPSTLIQACRYTRKVISTNCPSGPSEILGHGKYGILVPVNDALALTKAMFEIEDKTLDHDDYVFHHFSEEYVINKLVKEILCVV